MTQDKARPTPDGGDHSGGGPQGERIEGSLTDGGAMAGDTDEQRVFGAAREAAEHDEDSTASEPGGDVARPPVPPAQP
jgi:hypothetical protein